MEKNELRRKIESQNGFSRMPRSLIEKVFDVFEDNEGGEVRMQTMEELNQTYTLLKKAGLSWILSQKLSSLPEEDGSESIRRKLAESKEEFYSPIIKDLEIPKDIKEMVDNVIAAYYRNSGFGQGLKIQPPLEFILNKYLKHGPEQTFESIRNLQPNLDVRNRLSKEGANVDGFEKGIKRSYILEPDKGFVEGSRERIRSEMGYIYEGINSLGLLTGKTENYDFGFMGEELESLEKLLKANRFEQEKESLRMELKKRVQTAKSVLGSVRAVEKKETNVDFYVSQDPLESLHLGQYFSSCLSLSKLGNCREAWGSVVQTMDSNKNVIYAKSENRYVGRNRTVLTDKGILCTKFYPLRDTRLFSEWIDYLESFSEHVNRSILIPTNFVEGYFSGLLEKKVFWKKAKKVPRKVKIYPAYFNAFHSDGLKENKTHEGIEINSEFYVLGE